MAAVDAALERAGAAAGDVEALRARDDRRHERAARGRAARAPRSSPPRASPTSSSSAARRARDLYRLCAAHPRAARAAASGASPRPSAPAPTACCAPLRGRSTRSPRRSRRSSPRRSPSCLLHSYRHPEPRARHRRRRSPSACRTSTSRSRTRSSATFREYERAATTEVDAALSPLLRRLPARACRARRARRACPSPAIMQSSGGLTRRSSTPPRTPRSRSSAARPAARAAPRSSPPRPASPTLLCFDMGGTSCDVCVVDGGRVRETAGREIAGRPLALPMVDIHTVGAGGGSVAWRDPGGALRVGPRSRGRRAGPRLLRPRRDRADGDRREPPARPPRADGDAGRRRRARPRRRASARSASWPASSTSTRWPAPRGSCASPTPRWRARCAS